MNTQTIEQNKTQLKQLEIKLDDLQLVNRIWSWFLFEHFSFDLLGVSEAARTFQSIEKSAQRGDQPEEKQSSAAAAELSAVSGQSAADERAAHVRAGLGRPQPAATAH